MFNHVDAFISPHHSPSVMTVAVHSMAWCAGVTLLALTVLGCLYGKITPQITGAALLGGGAYFLCMLGYQITKSWQNRTKIQPEFPLSHFLAKYLLYSVAIVAPFLCGGALALSGTITSPLMLGLFFWVPTTLHLAQRYGWGYCPMTLRQKWNQSLWNGKPFPRNETAAK